MFKGISALDLLFLVRELKTVEGTIVEKIFHPSREELLFQLHKSGEGKKLLKILVGKGIFLTKQRYISEEGENPTSFCMFLRKKLKQTRIENVVQPELERIVEVQFSNKLKMIIEIFSKGNIILCDEENKILTVLEEQEWKDRIVKKGLVYIPPPARTNPFHLTEKEFAQKVNQSDRENIVKTIAMDFSLGGRYAEEVCEAAEIDKYKKRVDTSRLWKEVYGLQFRKAKPYLLMDETGANEFSPIELKIDKKREKKYFNLCSEALEKLFEQRSEEVQEEKEEKQRLEELAERQKQQVEELGKRSEEYKKIGDLIYRHFHDIETIVREYKAKKGDVQHPFIKEVNKKERKVILELQ